MSKAFNALSFSCNLISSHYIPILIKTIFHNDNIYSISTINSLHKFTYNKYASELNNDTKDLTKLSSNEIVGGNDNCVFNIIDGSILLDNIEFHGFCNDIAIFVQAKHLIIYNLVKNTVVLRVPRKSYQFCTFLFDFIENKHYISFCYFDSLCNNFGIFLYNNYSTSPASFSLPHSKIEGIFFLNHTFMLVKYDDYTCNILSIKSGELSHIVDIHFVIAARFIAHLNRSIIITSDYFYILDSNGINTLIDYSLYYLINNIETSKNDSSMYFSYDSCIPAFSEDFSWTCYIYNNNVFISKTTFPFSILVVASIDFTPVSITLGYDSILISDSCYKTHVFSI